MSTPDELRKIAIDSSVTLAQDTEPVTVDHSAYSTLSNPLEQPVALDMGGYTSDNPNIGFVDDHSAFSAPTRQFTMQPALAVDPMSVHSQHMAPQASMQAAQPPMQAPPTSTRVPLRMPSPVSMIQPPTATVRADADQHALEATEPGEREGPSSTEVVAAAGAVAGGGMMQRSSLVRVVLFGALALLFMFVFRRLMGMMSRAKTPTDAAPRTPDDDPYGSANIASSFEDIELAFASTDNEEDDVDEGSDTGAGVYPKKKTRREGRRDERRGRRSGTNKSHKSRRKPRDEHRGSLDAPETSDSEVSDDPNYCPL